MLCIPILDFRNCWAVEFDSPSENAIRPRRLKSIVHDFLFQRVCPELDFKEVNEVIAMGKYTDAKISPAVPRIIMDLGDRFPAFVLKSTFWIFVCYLYFLISMQ